MRRAALLGCLCLSLAACAGGGGSRTVTCAQDYWDGTYGTCLPVGWVVIDSETRRQRGVPEEVIAAFQAEEALSGQFPTATVTRERLAQAIDAKAYSDASIRSVSVLPGYSLLDSRPMTIDDEKLSLHVFTAQPVSGEPQRRFYQVSTVADGVGYTITGTASLSIDDATDGAIVLVLGSSTFRAPAKEE